MSSSGSSPAPFPFDSSSAYNSSSEPASTAPSSPPPDDPQELDVKFEEEAPTDAETSELEEKYKRLKHVLEQSTLYSSALKRQMDEAKEEHKKTRLERLAAARERRPAKRTRHSKAAEEPIADEVEDDGAFPQPRLVTGARLKDYQLEGLQWMVSLHSNGISGILADEMGLGKTLQTIAFSAHLREAGFHQPFLVVCPLSVLHNWVSEYEKFAPSIPVVMYHGTPADRAELRRTVMAIPPPLPAKSSPKPKPKPKPQRKSTPASRKRKRGSTAAQTSAADHDDDEDAAQEKQDKEDVSERYRGFPIIITTFELIVRDRTPLSAYPWGYIVVDEGHRLKNMDCRLIKEIKRYTSAGRMVLTGTPLHNNLAELWSLLNFILPDIFNDVEAFQEWFNLPSMQTLLPSSRMTTFISALHSILKPFLLRRLKSDVLSGVAALPPKKSYVLYAGLSGAQKEAYEAVVGGGVREWVAGERMREGDKRHGRDAPVDGPSKVDEEEEESVGKRTRGGRKGKGKVDEDEERRRAAEAFRLRDAAKHVNNMKLQNTVMQLRKVCSHPLLFARPGDEEVPYGGGARAPTRDEREAELVGASGKMMLLDRLLSELFRRGHKVLLFSQFTTMLDIIEDWAVEFKGWRICRIDGSTAPLERRDQMDTFQSAGDAVDAPRLFLLSTRAGGLGVNLTAADTVIFYDQDWNPQMDTQAQDRAHRIGQTKPVLIFRLVTAHTIEEKIMQRATEKRKLEALVIAKGKFKMPAAAEGAAHGRPATMAEMAAALLRLEGEQIAVVPDTPEGKASVLSDADMEMLLDRSPEVFTDRRKGWTSAEGANAAFAVYEPPADEGNDALAGMMGEEEVPE